MPDARRRRAYLDWLRGLAVLIMIQGHVLDSWTAEPYRHSLGFGWAVILGGFGGPLFLFLAGVSVVLSAASKARRSGNERSAARSVVGRGVQIFGLAFVFRLQSWLLSQGPVSTLLRVDILNIMGPAIAAAAAIWGAAKTTRGKVVALGCAAIAVSLLTPPVRAASWLSALPDPVEGYFRPIPGLTNFVWFPSAGFVFAGAVIGVLVERTQTRETEGRLNVALGAGGAALIAVAFAGSYLPSIYERSSFWTSSPSYFGIRAGLLALAMAMAYAWERRSDGHRWSPLQQLGRTSLFIYWIHVEMVYGRMSEPLHRSLGFSEAWAALAAFAVLMLGVSLAKDWLAGRFRVRAGDRP